MFPPNLRQNNILDLISQQSSPTTPDMGVINPSAVSNSNDDQIAMQRLAALFHPSYDMQNKLSNVVEGMPKRSDYPVSTGRNIGAMLAGLGTATPSTYSGGAALGFNANIPEGMKIQSDLKNQKFNEATTDWARKLEPTEKLAQLENVKNTNERVIANNVMGRNIQQQRADEYERGRKATEDINRTRATTSAMRAQVYAEKAHGSIIKENSEGHLIAIDPITNQTQILTNDDGEPIKSSHLSEVDKINLGLKASLAKIEAQGKKEKDVEGVKQGNREAVIGQKGDEARKTKTTTPAIAAKPPRRTTTTVTLDKNGNPISKDVLSRDELSNELVNGPTSDLIKMVDKDGKIWHVKPEDVEKFKKANGIK